jgi:hypothetical protein
MKAERLRKDNRLEEAIKEWKELKVQVEGEWQQEQPCCCLCYRSWLLVHLL